MRTGFIAASATLAAIGISLFHPSPAHANPQAAAFEVLRAAPNDPDAILAYARAAVAARDYEAVVSTLERLLDLEPRNLAARYELAVAYFALGSYELAAFHFRKVQTLAPGSAQAARTSIYLDQIAEDTSGQVLTGRAAAGIAVTDDGTAASASVALRWSVDMGGANDHAWITGLRANVFAGDDGLDSSRVLVRTGPQFSVDGRAFGVRLRPYVEARHVEDANDLGDYSAYGIGLQYLNAHTVRWSSFADLNFSTVTGDIDGDVWSATVGMSYTPTRTSRVRFLLGYSERDADNPAQDRTRQTMRIEWRKAFANPLREQGRNWVGTAFVQQDMYDFGSGRDDTITSAGVSVRSFINAATFVETGLRYVNRASSDPARDDSTPVFSVSIGRAF